MADQGKMTGGRVAQPQHDQVGQCRTRSDRPGQTRPTDVTPYVSVCHVGANKSALLGCRIRREWEDR